MEFAISRNCYALPCRENFVPIGKAALSFRGAPLFVKATEDSIKALNRQGTLGIIKAAGCKITFKESVKAQQLLCGLIEHTVLKTAFKEIDHFPRWDIGEVMAKDPCPCNKYWPVSNNFSDWKSWRSSCKSSAFIVLLPEAGNRHPFKCVSRYMKRGSYAGPLPAGSSYSQRRPNLLQIGKVVVVFVICDPFCGEYVHTLLLKSCRSSICVSLGVHDHFLKGRNTCTFVVVSIFSKQLRPLHQKVGIGCVVVCIVLSSLFTCLLIRHHAAPDNRCEGCKGYQSSTDTPKQLDPLRWIIRKAIFALDHKEKAEKHKCNHDAQQKQSAAEPEARLPHGPTQLDVLFFGVVHPRLAPAYVVQSYRMCCVFLSTVMVVRRALR